MPSAERFELRSTISLLQCCVGGRTHSLFINAVRTHMHEHARAVVPAPERTEKPRSQHTEGV